MPDYPTTYRDRLGPVTTSIHDDGGSLHIMLRGVAFSGPDFDALSPERPLSEDERGLFVLSHDDLCACSLSWSMPLTILANGDDLAAELHAELELGDPTAGGGITAERLTLRLVSAVGEFVSRGLSGWFEGELLEIQAQLPPGCALKSCMTCAHSDYSPYGHGLWGSMACFRDNKEAYGKVRSKSDLFAIWDEMTAYVPETFLCPEFCLRRAGTGYRG